MTKDEARSSVMGAISMALKDPTLQQGFEIICKNLSELEETNAKLQAKIDDWQSEYIELENFKNNEIAELKEQIEKMKCWHKMDYNDKESCKKIPRGIQLLTEYDCGLFVAYCVNRWTGDHWEEHTYGVTAWKEIELSKEIKEND